MSYKSKLCSAVAFSVLSWASNTVLAQTTSSQSNQASMQLEEIVVTANKRSEAIQDVPASVVAVTADTLERLNVRSFDDLVTVVPGVTITKTTQPANNSINIRGIGTYAYSIATQPSTVVVVDDIPQAFQSEAFTSLVDVQQIEVLRGPQSTLFGKSASAGVISITTQGPTDVFSGHAEVMATNDHEEKAQASISGPITDSLKFRLTGSIDDYRGNLHNLATGSWLDGAEGPGIARQHRMEARR